jgi:hypothetical protein
MLEDEAIREKEGREMEILAMATEKAKRTLHELHQYADNSVDSPILSPEALEVNDQEL